MTTIDLRWARPVDGCWFAPGTIERPRRSVASIHGRDLYVIAGLQRDLDRLGATSIEPLRQCPALFRTFANLALTADAAASFADRYGLLTSRPGDASVVYTWDPLASDEENLPLHAARGEPLSLWTAAIAELGAVVTLWDLVQAGNVDGLTAFVRWDEPAEHRARGISFAPPYTGRLHISGLWDDSEPWVLDGLYPDIEPQPIPVGDVIRPAAKYVRRAINRRIAGAVTPALFADEGRGASEIGLVPAHLLVGLWLQFAAAVDADARFRRCDAPDCDQWFELKPPATRKSRLFCSEACRVRAFRARQAPPRPSRTPRKQPKGPRPRMQ